jgi:asparagine synthase (glutamine-hydrolysing)
MSGIYGIYRFDGAPVDPQWMERMRAAMAYYGPDGGCSRIEGPVGMGHLLLEVNPEDAHEVQPYRSGRGLVASAARLDNREELLTAFAIPSSEAETISDGDLVSRAFERWGDDVCSHLQGDWSLAAWDAHRRKLLLGLNACGNATLYYYEGKGFIAFSSALKALLALPGITHEPDMLRLAQVLTGWLNDADLTAYKGFRRLSWAQVMHVDAAGKAHIVRHWSPEGRELLRYKRDEEYEEAFLEVFQQSVRSSLRTHKPVAAHLSGGRDSGSVVALAAPILAEQGRELTAYTSVPRFAPDGAGNVRNGNEWDNAHATALMAGANVRHIPIDAAEYGIRQSIDYFLDMHDGPDIAFANVYWIQAISETAATQGHRLVLTGALGNGTVSWKGCGYAISALLQKDWNSAFQLLLQGEENLWEALWQQILKPALAPTWRYWHGKKYLGYSDWLTKTALHSDAVSALKVAHRMAKSGWDPIGTVSPLENPRMRYFTLEMYGAISIFSECGARHGITYVDPTFSQRMVEFQLRAPEHLFHRHGRSCDLMRRAFRNRLPELVLSPPLRGLQGADLGYRILREKDVLLSLQNTLATHPMTKSFLDTTRMCQVWNALEDKIDMDSTRSARVLLMRGLGVGVFLQQFS